MHNIHTVLASDDLTCCWRYLVKLKRTDLSINQAENNDVSFKRH